MIRHLLIACAGWLLALCAAAQVPAQSAAPTEPAPALDLREQVIELPVKATNLYGQAFSASIPVTIFRPAGDGPFPLAVMNHGRTSAERATHGRSRFEALSRYLVSKGFAVFVPTRLGYGATFAVGDPEEGGGCSRLRPEPMSNAASDQILAVVAHASTLPWVDASRWVVLGQSVGGLASVAVAWRQPPGLVAAVNFSGGAGGNPTERPADPCSPAAIQALWGSKASAAVVPMLWLYWENDRYWGPEWPRQWARAWRGGGGRLDFQQLPPAGTDGHVGLTIDMDHWVPLVEAYLVQRGFVQPGLIERPAASGFAELTDLDRLPAGRNARELYANRFLAAKLPRAFAIGPQGASGWATGDWAPGRALGFCQRGRGVACRLYAVDNDVVWAPP